VLDKRGLCVWMEVTMLTVAIDLKFDRWRRKDVLVRQGKALI
jgi:hypothetical protein